jgi:hypothetical protein
MGNSTSAPAPPEPPIKDDGYKWPDNLYTEMRDMAAVSFLIYAFAYASDVARKVGLQGLDLTDTGKIQKSATRDLPRSFTPQDILKLLETNREKLIAHSPSTFEDGPNYDLLVKNLKGLQGTITHARLLLLASVFVLEE